MKNHKRKFSVLLGLPEAKIINEYTDPLRAIETKKKLRGTPNKFKSMNIMLFK